jgi:hypothetical protein
MNFIINRASSAKSQSLQIVFDFFLLFLHVHESLHIGTQEFTKQNFQHNFLIFFRVLQTTHGALVTNLRQFLLIR